MEEQNPIDLAYKLFQEEGYNGSVEEFQQLLNSDANAVNTAYQFFVEEGYEDDVNTFVELMGISVEKKNPDVTSTQVQDVMESDTPPDQVVPGSSESSVTDPSDPNKVDPNKLVNPETISEGDTSAFEFDTLEVKEELDEPDDYFSQSLQKIDKTLIDREEQQVVPLMNYHFGDYGFEFEQTGGLDAMKVRSKNGKEIRINLDPFTGNLFGSEDRESKKLREFLRTNKDESQKLYFLEEGFKHNTAKIQSEKEVKNKIKDFSERSDVQAKNIKEYIRAKTFYDQNDLDNADPNKVIYTRGPEGDIQATTPLQLKLKLLDAENLLAKQEQVLKLEGKELDEKIGAWSEMRSRQGSSLGGLWNAIADGFAGIDAGKTNFLVDIMVETVGLDFSNPVWYRTTIMEKAREKGLLGSSYSNERIADIAKDPDKFSEVENLIKKAAESRDDVDFKDLRKEIKDEEKKRIKYERDPDEIVYRNPYSLYANDTKYDTNTGLLEAIRKGNREVWGTETTPEWTEKTEETFWGGAVLGVTKSLPAIIQSGYLRPISMVLQAQDYVLREMEQPQFADVTENEKAAFVIPLGTVVGLLENYGVRNVLAQKGVANGILLRVLNKKGVNITNKTFRDVVKKEVNNMIAQGTLILGAGGLAEFETGFLQEVADISFKEAYNAWKGSDLFQTPESFTDGVQQVLRAAAQEAVGGKIMSMPGAVATAASKGDFTTLDEGVFELFEDLHNSDVVKDTYVQKIKQEILDGKIDKKAGQNKIAMYDQVVGVMNKIPADLPTPKKKILLANLLRQQELSDYIDKYNNQLTKRQQNEKAELEAEVDKIIKEGDAQLERDKALLEQREKAIQELKDDGVENPTPEQINNKIDASTKQSPVEKTGEVESETTQEVVEGVSDQVQRPAREGDQESGTETETKTEEEVEEGEVQVRYGKETEEDLMSDLDFENTNETKEGPVPKNLFFFGPKNRSNTYKEDGTRNKYTAKINPKNPFEVEKTEVWTVQKIKDIIAKGHDAIVVRDPNLGVIETIPLDKSIITLVKQETETDQNLQQEVGDLEAAVGQQTGTETTTETDSETISITKNDGAKVNYKGRSISDNVKITENVTVKEKIISQAKKAGKAISKILPGVNIIVHSTEDAYNKAVSEDSQDSQGTFAPMTNTIHINASKALDTTIPHEIFHALLVKKFGLQPNFKAQTERMLKAVIKSVKNPEVKKVLKEFAADYETVDQSEEQTAELFGMLAANYTSLSTEPKNIIKRWLNRLIKLSGLPININEFTKEEKDIIDFFNTASKKVQEGTEITEGDIELLHGEILENAEGKIPNNIPDDGGSIDLETTEKNQIDRGGIDLKKIKRGSINDISGVNAFVFAADQATYGNIESPSGTKFMFNGGYLYPYGSESQGSNAAWVFATEEAANKVLNKAKESDGVGLVMSQVATGITGNLQFYDFVNAEIANAVEKGASPKELIKYINEKLKLTEVAKGLKAKGLPAQISSLEELQTLLVPLNFEQRANFNQSFLSKDSYDQFGISPFAPLKTVPTNLQDVVNDPSLRNVKYGDIISAIEFDQDGKPFKINKGDPGYHPAYPWALPGKPMMVFNNAVDVRKVYPEAKPRGKKTNQTPIGKRLKKDAARSAMGGQYVARVPKEVPVESETINLQEKNQKAGMDRLVKFYQMNDSGFIKPNIYSRAALTEWAKSLGFTVDVSRGDIGEITSYYLRDVEGNIYRPKDKNKRQIKEKSQKVFNKFDDPVDIIKTARVQGFTDPAITDYLTRVRKFGKRLISSLMKVDVDIFSSIPPSLGSIEGGMVNGIKLYTKVFKKYNQLLKKNARAKVKKSEQEIMDETMEYLKSQSAFKKLADKNTKSLSTKQRLVEIEIAEALGGRKSNDLAQAIKRSRIILNSKKRGARELKLVQQELRNFLRKVMPKTVYVKSDLNRLLKLINDATVDNIENVRNQILEEAAKKNNEILERIVTDLLKTTGVKKINDRLKGVQIDNETRKRLQEINKLINPNVDLNTFESVTNYLASLEKKYNDINKKPAKTNSDYDTMENLRIAIQRVTSSLLMENTDLAKVETLAELSEQLKQIILTGRTNFKEQLRQQHLEYRRQFESLFLDITGRKESFEEQARKELEAEGVENPSNEEVQDKVTDIIEDIKKNLNNIKDEQENRESSSNILKRIGKKLNRTLLNTMNKNSDLFILMDAISKLPGEIFEGNTQELVTKRIDEATRIYKERMLTNQAFMIVKMRELFGKNYKKVMAKYTRKLPQVIIKDKEAVEKAEKAYRENPTKENNQKLEDAIMKHGVSLSPNQMYYLYNQYKDPQNHPGFEARFGPNYEQIMQDITNELETNYPELKEYADWQVNVFFPMLYEHYNEAYKDLYRVDMPYNLNYAGMVYREGVESEGQDILSGTPQYNSPVTANSTKLRNANAKKAIVAVDGNDALFSYMRDMEYFAAYGRPVNDINKLFSNKIIRDTIDKLYPGSNLNEVIQAAIEKLSNKGISKAGANLDTTVNIMQDVFILSRLGINPVVTLKQLTSFITYANDIGPLNWMKNAAASRFLKGKSVSEVWKEISENSVYLQDRDSKSITKALELYTNRKLGDKDTFESLTGIRPGQRETLIDILMFTTRVGDRGAIYLGGVPNYVYYKEQALKDGKSEEEAIQIAIRKFERDTKRTQQSTDLQDRDYYQTKNPYFRALNMFLTTPRQYFRKEIYSIRNLYRLLKTGGKEGKGTKMQNARTFFTYHFVMPMFFQYVANGFPGLLAEWEEEDEKDLMRAAIIGNLNALFIYGEFIQNLGYLATDKPEQFFTNFKNLPLITQFQDLLKSIGEYRDSKKRTAKDAAGFQVLRRILEFTGLPLNQLNNAAKNLKALADGEDDPGKVILRLFNYSDYQIEGRKRKSRKVKERKFKRNVMKDDSDNKIFNP